MDNDKTKFINDEPARTEQTFHQNQPQASQARKRTNGHSATRTAGAFVAGAAAGVGVNAYAADSAETMLDVNEELIEDTTAPEPDQVILANDDGIRYAHVEADNFSDAFSQARAQVGSGGVFEYNGRLYSTFTAEEWNAMSAEERADYQNRVSGISEQNPNDAYNPESDPNSVEDIEVNAEMISVEPVDNEIRVLGIDTVQTDDGQIMNVALVECEGEQALLVDVDNNGTIDVMISEPSDIDGLQDPEVHDISGTGLHIDDLAMAQAAENGHFDPASQDDFDDYYNDVDSCVTI